MIRIDINDPNLTLRDRPTNWGDGVYLYKGEVFTGIMYEFFPNTNKLSFESEYNEGIPEGRQVEFWLNVNLKVVYFQKYDYYVGSIKSWSENGQLISHQVNDEFGNWVKTIL
jgi:antitoxin component YwqK of YwqJK toxin-antitoxin module